MKTAKEILKKHTDEWFLKNKMARFDDLPNDVIYAAMEEYASMLSNDEAGNEKDLEKEAMDFANACFPNKEDYEWTFQVYNAYKTGATSVLESKRDMLNRFCTQVQDMMNSTGMEHSAHAIFCDKLNDVKAKFLEESTSQPKEQGGLSTDEVVIFAEDVKKRALDNALTPDEEIMEKVIKSIPEFPYNENKFYEERILQFGLRCYKANPARLTPAPMSQMDADDLAQKHFDEQYPNNDCSWLEEQQCKNNFIAGYKAAKQSPDVAVDWGKIWDDFRHVKMGVSYVGKENVFLWFKSRPEFKGLSATQSAGFTIEDMRKCFEAARKRYWSEPDREAIGTFKTFDDYIQSLTKKG